MWEIKSVVKGDICTFLSLIPNSSIAPLTRAEGIFIIKCKAFTWRLSKKWLNESTEVLGDIRSHHTETHLIFSPSLKADFSYNLF